MYSRAPSFKSKTTLEIRIFVLRLSLRGRTHLGRHTPVQGRYRHIRANVSPLDQADVTNLQQFIVDAYAKLESERLQFLRREKDHLMADNSQISPGNHNQSRWRPWECWTKITMASVAKNDTVQHRFLEFSREI